MQCTWALLAEAGLAAPAVQGIATGAVVSAQRQRTKVIEFNGYRLICGRQGGIKRYREILFLITFFGYIHIQEQGYIFVQKNSTST